MPVRENGATIQSLPLIYDASDQKRAAAYISDIAGELSKIAGGKDLAFLAHLLSMARVEAIVIAGKGRRVKSNIVNLDKSAPLKID